jgi:uncharacterized BrkB/YihY/UPF0761 family membrane protein
MAFKHTTEKPAEGAARHRLLRTLWQEIFSDHAAMMAAGLAYYAIFGLLPALEAAAAMWGPFGDMDALEQGLQHSGSMLPVATVQLLDEFLTSVPKGVAAAARRDVGDDQWAQDTEHGSVDPAQRSHRQ